jgi:Prophage minor tail protein Z (GPZ)
MVAITIDPRQLNKLQNALGHIKGGVPNALSGAINRTLRKGRTTIRREIRKEYVIKQKDIPIKIHSASRATLSGEIVIKDTMMLLGKFRVSPIGVQRRATKRTVHAQVKVGGGGDIPHAFMTGLAYPGPFVRKGTPRLPIRALLSISAPIMASQPTVGQAANKAMGDSMAVEIDRNIKRVLAQAGGKS